MDIQARRVQIAEMTRDTLEALRLSGPTPTRASLMVLRDALRRVETELAWLDVNLVLAKPETTLPPSEPFGQPDPSTADEKCEYRGGTGRV